MEPQDDDGWDPVETPEQARDILAETVFEFADIILNLVIEDEGQNPQKYRNMLVKPSTKIRVVTALLQLFEKNRLCEHYTNYVLNWSSYIINRDEKFFLENDYIFPGAPKEDIEFFRDLWRPGSTFHLNKDEKEIVFEYFDTMFHFCGEWKRLTNFRAKWESDNFDPTEEARRRAPKSETSYLHADYAKEQSIQNSNLSKK